MANQWIPANEILRLLQLGKITQDEVQEILLRQYGPPAQTTGLDATVETIVENTLNYIHVVAASNNRVATLLGDPVRFDVHWVAHLGKKGRSEPCLREDCPADWHLHGTRIYDYVPAVGLHSPDKYAPATQSRLALYAAANSFADLNPCRGCHVRFNGRQGKQLKAEILGRHDTLPEPFDMLPALARMWNVALELLQKHYGQPPKKMAPSRRREQTDKQDIA